MKRHLLHRFAGTTEFWSDHVTFLGNGRYLLEGIADDGATVSEELSTEELVANLSEADNLDENEGPMGPRLRSLLDLAEAEADENLVKILLSVERGT